MENCTACYIERSPSFARLSLHAIREDPFASYGYSFFSFTPGRQNRPSIDTLPVYMESEALPPPSYAVRDEPVTFAMYLFIIGFLIFPFWILGAFIFFSPLRIPSSSDEAGEWMPGKTIAEKQAIIDKIRCAELRWARRCLVALPVFVPTALGSGITIWALLKA